MRDRGCGKESHSTTFTSIQEEVFEVRRKTQMQKRDTHGVKKLQLARGIDGRGKRNNEREMKRPRKRRHEETMRE